MKQAMEGGLIDSPRTVLAHLEAAQVPEPFQHALLGPTSAVLTWCPTVLNRRPGPVFAVPRNQSDATRRQLLSHRIAIVITMSDEPSRFLSRSALSLSPPYGHQRRHCLNELD
jgi:hypothetical protein